jgi:hypothetical protein
MEQTKKVAGISKITAKAVLGKIAKPDSNDSPLEVMRVAGVIASIKTTPSAFDPARLECVVTGEFIATNLLTGELFSSGTFYPMGAAMSDIMKCAEVGNQFAMSVYVVASQKSPTGYAFDFRTVTEVKVTETLKSLMNLFEVPKELTPPVTPDTQEEPKKKTK